MRTATILLKQSNSGFTVNTDKTALVCTALSQAMHSRTKSTFPCHIQKWQIWKCMCIRIEISHKIWICELFLLFLAKVKEDCQPIHAMRKKNKKNKAYADIPSLPAKFTREKNLDHWLLISYPLSQSPSLSEFSKLSVKIFNLAIFVSMARIKTEFMPYKSL